MLAQSSFENTGEANRAHLGAIFVPLMTSSQCFLYVWVSLIGACHISSLFKSSNHTSYVCVLRAQDGDQPAPNTHTGQEMCVEMNNTFWKWFSLARELVHVGSLRPGWWQLSNSSWEELGREYILTADYNLWNILSQGSGLLKLRTGCKNHILKLTFIWIWIPSVGIESIFFLEMISLWNA